MATASTSNPYPQSAKKEEAITIPVGREELEHFHLIDLFFFSYRDFTAEADRKLEHMDYGRAHHRALYFINRRPGMTVAELLDILAITKQSLSRVLRQLIDNGFITQHAGATDRRQRLLYPTNRGRDLLLSLSQPQSSRISNALQTAFTQTGLSATREEQQAVINAFLKSMIDSQNQRHIENLG